jgi:hypothetical protein
LSFVFAFKPPSLTAPYYRLTTVPIFVVPDHWAALIVEDQQCSVFAIDGKKGSMLPDNTFTSANNGLPGVWIKGVVDGKITTQVLEGLFDLLGLCISEVCSCLRLADLTKTKSTRM